MLTDREKRCLTRAWDRREARVDKKFHNRHAYVKRRVAEVGEQCKRDGALLHRLHTATWEGVEILLFEGEAEHGSDAGDGTTADGPDPSEEDSAAPISLAQLRRLDFQEEPSRRTASRRCARRARLTATSSTWSLVLLTPNERLSLLV